MKQLDKVIISCLKAINAKIPVLYLESDDITLVDQILNSERLVSLWTKTVDEEWYRSKDLTPDNIFISENKFNPVHLQSNENGNPFRCFDVPQIFGICNIVWDNEIILALTSFANFQASDKGNNDFVVLYTSHNDYPLELKPYIEFIDVLKLKQRYSATSLNYEIEQLIANAKKKKIHIFLIKDNNNNIWHELLNNPQNFPLAHYDMLRGWLTITSTTPDNVFVYQSFIGDDFVDVFRIAKSGIEGFRNSKSMFLSETARVPWLKTIDNIHYIIAVKNYLPSATGSEKLGMHISRVLSSQENDPIRRCIILLQSGRVNVPTGLEPYIELIEVPALSDEEIKDIIDSFIINDKPIPEFLNKYIENLRGFSESKIRDILSRIKLQYGGLFKSKALKKDNAIAVIREVKAQMVKKEGLLELVKVDENLKVSGLEAISTWLRNRVILFENPTIAKKLWNLEAPKGVLVSGIPGTGKSALAKQISNIFRKPLLKFDFGSLLGHMQGESESNMRRVLKLAEKMSPCILWIDELEKGFSAASSSGDSDGGQGKRLFGQFLTWMQEKKEACFIFATANDISTLPPEFLRRGRFDQKFYTFMPTKEECVSIFKSVMERYNNPTTTPFHDILNNEDDFKREINLILEECGEKGKFMQGSDIDGIINDAMFNYYLNYWSGTSEVGQRYVPTKFYSEIRNAIDEVSTYGETDSTKIAICLLGLAVNKFKSASSDSNIVNIMDVNPKDVSISEYKGVANLYDELLHALIVREIEHLNKSGYNPETGKYDRNRR